MVMLVATMPLGFLVWKRAAPSAPEQQSSRGEKPAIASLVPNELDLGSQHPKPSPVPVPRRGQLFSYHVILPGESIHRIAANYNMTPAEIADLNPAIGRFEPGVRLRVFALPKQPLTLKPPSAKKKPTRYRVPVQGISHGRSNRGWLENGMQLPKLDDLYLRAQPKEQYGTSTVIQHIIDAITDLRDQYGYQGQIVVGDLSIRRGGHFPPHKSHRTGRDVDIWLPVRGSKRSNHTRPRSRPQPEEVDWLATWQLIDALVATEAVHKIFLSYHLQERLRNAARRHGISEEELDLTIQYPGRDPDAIVRHSPAHTRHIHVRFRCSLRDKQLGRPACED